jgi:hypothetical protein
MIKCKKKRSGAEAVIGKRRFGTGEWRIQPEVIGLKKQA